LHAERSDDAANVFISPLSLSMALGMLLNTTGGETFNAMADALGLNGLLMTEANDAYIPFTLSRYFRGREGTAQQGPSGPVGAEVTMNDQLRYEPAVVTISAGQAVRWRNPSAVVYTVTTDPSKAMQAGIVRLPSGVDAFNSGDIGPEGLHLDIHRAGGVPVPLHSTRRRRDDGHDHGSLGLERAFESG
jgi:plastocyanin